MIWLKLVPFANYFLVCLEKFPSSMKNCYIQDCYSAILVLCLSVMKCLFIIYGELRSCYEKYVKGEDHFMKAREIIMNRLMLSILPFRVWNHTFLCERSQYCIGMCNFCTKSYVSNKKISDHINKTLFVPIEEFHTSIRKEIVLAEKFIYLHMLMSLLIRMTRLENLLILILCTMRALALHFLSGRCIWTLFVE